MTRLQGHRGDPHDQSVGPIDRPCACRHRREPQRPRPRQPEHAVAPHPDWRRFTRIPATEHGVRELFRVRTWTEHLSLGGHTMFQRIEPSNSTDSLPSSHRPEPEILDSLEHGCRRHRLKCSVRAVPGTADVRRVRRLGSSVTRRRSGVALPRVLAAAAVAVVVLVGAGKRTAD